MLYLLIGAVVKITVVYFAFKIYFYPLSSMALDKLKGAKLEFLKNLRIVRRNVCRSSLRFQF